VSNQKSFTITLTPHRSMSRPASTALVCAFGAINLIVSLKFYAMGAWPICAFCALSVALLAVAFVRNYASANAYERILFDDDLVTLARHGASGSADVIHFNRRWLRIELEYDEVREVVGRLFLRSSGRSYEIAAFLGAEERKSLAKALRRSV
jgi:uncharacterized membrane protein